MCEAIRPRRLEERAGSEKAGARRAKTDFLPVGTHPPTSLRAEARATLLEEGGMQGITRGFVFASDKPFEFEFAVGMVSWCWLCEPSNGQEGWEPHRGRGGLRKNTGSNSQYGPIFFFCVVFLFS